VQALLKWWLWRGRGAETKSLYSTDETRPRSAELGVFTASASQARHACMGGDPPKRTMTPVEARQMIGTFGCTGSMRRPGDSKLDVKPHTTKRHDR
jgi:hypothetical protein